jgi:outer membrane protein assembly factor BamB
MACGLTAAVLTTAVCLAERPDLPAGQASQDWPQWRGKDGENHSPVTGIRKNWNEAPPELVWEAEGLGEGYASVSVADGRIYTTGNFEGGQGVICINLADGQVVWKKPLTDKTPKHGYQGSRSTPTVDGDRLYLVTSDGEIVCLKSTDGSEVWRREFSEWKGKMMSGWGYSESPLVDGDHVLCTPGGEEAMIVCLNKMNGEQVWAAAVPPGGQNGKDGAGYSSIRISNAAGIKQYVQLIGRGVIGVDAATGKLLWQYNRVANGTANIPTPLVTGDYVFCSSGYGTGSALLKISKSGDGCNAEEIYFLNGNEVQNHHGGMILLGENIYLGNGHNKGFPTCVRMSDGEILWGGKLRGPGDGSAAVLLVDGSLIFRYQSGEVALVEATPTGYNLQGVFKPKHVIKEAWAHPVAIDGVLLLREQDKLMCYGLK